MMGPHYLGHGMCLFTVWAPFADRVVLKLVSPEQDGMVMEKKENGYWEVEADGVFPGTLYLYELDGKMERPDPASHFQPQGVHGPSRIVDHEDFAWRDGNWKGLPLDDYVIYELHVGTFTEEGTFEAVIPWLDYLGDLGITVIELMPVAQFPGGRNWGYDGAYLFAPQNSYGGPSGLKRLVDACHAKGFAVALDVVYNHLGPEGNYLGDFGPYFTDAYRTPWGNTINFDGPYSDDVRKFFVSNALYWVIQYHMDALRIDAIHHIFDFSARHFLEYLAGEVHRTAAESGRNIYVIPESDLNNVRIINPREIGGYNLDAQWNDDFHHSLHSLITGENHGYYQDFGKTADLAKAFREGFVYSGEYSKYRKRTHGSPSKDRSARQFVVFSQNHDQVGNRPLGDRLAGIQSLEKLKLAAATVILSPFIPLLFMGEEYGEVAPFLYFVSHSDESLIEGVRSGRREEFARLSRGDEVCDPQAESAFIRSKLNMALRQEGAHQVLHRFYSHLFALRKKIPALSRLSKEFMAVTSYENEKILLIRRWWGEDQVLIFLGFNGEPVSLEISLPTGGWTKVLDASDAVWGGPGETARGHIESSARETRVELPPFCVLLYGNGERLHPGGFKECGS